MILLTLVLYPAPHDALQDDQDDQLGQGLILHSCFCISPPCPTLILMPPPQLTVHSDHLDQRPNVLELLDSLAVSVIQGRI